MHKTRGLRGHNLGAEDPSEVSPGDGRLGICLPSPGPPVGPCSGAWTPPSSQLPLCRLSVLGLPGWPGRGAMDVHGQRGTVQCQESPLQGVSLRLLPDRQHMSWPSGYLSAHRHCPCRPLSQGVLPASPISPAPWPSSPSVTVLRESSVGCRMLGPLPNGHLTGSWLPASLLLRQPHKMPAHPALPLAALETLSPSEAAGSWPTAS